MTIQGHALIADDHKPSADLIAFLLRSHFPELEIDVAYDIESVNGMRYDLAIIDYGLNGGTAHDVLKKFTGRTPTIIITAYPLEDVQKMMKGHTIIAKGNGFNQELLKVAEGYLLKEQIAKKLDRIITTYNRMFPPQKPTIIQKLKGTVNGWRGKFV